MGKMKIALLNLPYDNNYGGNLQRYALMKVLQDMGHDVTHLNLRFDHSLSWYKKPYSYTKRIILKYGLGRDVRINQEKYSKEQYEKCCMITEPFYQEYIKHTEPIYKLSELKKYSNFDAYVVGSDQVWRKKIANRYLLSMFLDFLPKDCKVKRIAYGVSLGVAENELSVGEISQLSELYKRFDAVSVREKSALSLFDTYGWINPKARTVLDPTLLLDKSDYQELIRNTKTEPSNGNMFCYILDNTEEKQKIVDDLAKRKGLTPFRVALDGNHNISVEQWLRSFDDAEYVITDSYHGLLFSIIFRKPFYLMKNPKRGNARFNHIISDLGLNNNDDINDWRNIQLILSRKRLISINFLRSNLQ